MRFAAPVALVLAVFTAACASMESPPGGPPDAAAAVLVRTVPDTGAVNVRPGSAVFVFDEVVAERQSSGTLADLFLISPSDGAPSVDWDRRSVEVRPRRGWRPNTTYTVTLLPGLMDLRGNRRTDGASIVFSTGSTIATSELRGIVFDWVAGRVVPEARVEAISRPDSTVYVGRADSGGVFSIPNMPSGDYTVRGLVDANKNRAIDPRELWDSVRVTLRDTAHVELLAFAHDTVAPRIDRVVVRDSFTVHATIDRPIDPAMTIDTSVFRLLRSDSTAVSLVEARPAAVYEREQAERDRARADSTARAAPPLPPVEPRPRPPDPRTTIAAVTPSRPSPVIEVVIVVSQPLRAGATYRLEAELRGMLGATATSSRAFTRPEAPKTPPPATTAPATTPPAGPPPGSPPPVPPPVSRR